MKKKKSGGGGANWMDTYGDMVTLLLCFFVLLYSMSTISEEKWLALVMSFNPDAAETATETPGGDGPSAEADETGGGLITQQDIDAKMDDLYEQIQTMVQREGDQGKNNNISVFRDSGKVYISFNQTVFFDGESASLRKESHPVLNEVSDILDSCLGAIDEVRILGHTAQGSLDKPNDPYTDRSLSSLRAANVAAYIQEAGELDPARLVSEGLGQWRPIAPNSSAEGRAKNRRVEMIISGRDLQKELDEGIQHYETDSADPDIPALQIPAEDI